MARDVVARSAEGKGLCSLESSPHPALVFERFPRLLSRRGDGYGLDDEARLRWLDEFVKLAAETRERRQRLDAVHARLDALALVHDGLRREARTAWRLAVGLGNPSATDVGMTFDFACGVPCLPGSSVKGLARAGAELLEAEERRMAELLGVGPLDGDDGASGTVVFLDALPLRWPAFEVDIVTRHHDAQALPKQKTPLDTDKPNPVHFLTVAPKQIFVFRLLPTADTQADSLGTVWRWLKAALDELGAGAKTAVGYGQMVAVADE